jgi:hypothetical protein
VANTGFDLPALEVAVMARPTKFAGLYVQSVGRVLRLSPGTGKTRALILDVVGAVRLGLASVVDLKLTDPDPDPIEDPEPKSPRIRKEAPPTPGEVRLIPVDPFTGGRKRTRWLMTPGHVPFLPGTMDYPAHLFLWSEPGGLWTLGALPQRGMPTRIQTGMEFPAAVALAENMNPKPMRLSGPPSEAQLRFAASLGIAVPAVGATKQNVSDAINLAVVSKAVDPR